MSVVARSCCTQHPLIPASARAVITRHTRIKLACSPHVITRNGPRNPPFWRQPCAPGLQQRRRRPTSSDRAPKLQKTPVMIAGSGPRLLMPRKKWQTGSGAKLASEGATGEDGADSRTAVALISLVIITLATAPCTTSCCSTTALTGTKNIL